MPLYSLVGTPIQFTVTDKAAEAFNRMDIALLRQTIIVNNSADVPLTNADMQFMVDLEDVFLWKKVTTVIEVLQKVNGGYSNNFTGDIYDFRLVKI